MALRQLVRSNAASFLWNLACSENDSESRHGETWRRALGPELSRRVAAGEPSALSHEDWAAIRSAFETARGPYLGPLLRLEPEWWSAGLPVEEIGELLVIRHAPITRLAPDRRLREFVAALDDGGDTAPDRSAGRYHRLRPRFEQTRARGMPVIVGPALDGPWVEADGLTRLAICWSRRADADATARAMPVLVGVSPRIAEWPSF